MLTNNWYNYFKLYMASGGNSFNTTAVATVKDPTGNTYYPTCYTNADRILWYNATQTLSTGVGAAGIAFGDGAVAPTREDYSLSGNYISTLSMVSKTYGIYEEGDALTGSITFVLKNTGSAPVTISEVAWFERYYHNGGMNNNYVKAFMLDRTLLSSPVTIPAGQQGVVVYKLSVTPPT